MDENLQAQLMMAMVRFKRAGPHMPLTAGPQRIEQILLHQLALHQDMDIGLSVSDIQRRMFMSRPALSQVLGSLEHQELVVRRIDPNDRRRIIVALTPKGREAVRGIQVQLDGLFAQLLERFGADDTRTLIRLLNRLGDVFEQMEKEMDCFQEKGEDDTPC